MASPWTALSATARGDWHEKTGQKNQDSVLLKKLPYGGVVLALSDGHGSPRSFRSDRGSKFAVDCAVKLLESFICRFGHDAPISLVRRQMETKWLRQLLNDWKSAVRADIQADPFSPIDFAAFPEPAPVFKAGHDLPFTAYLAYGATLLVAVLTRHYTIYVQLGDGDILTVDIEGTVSRPLERLHPFFAEQSASLCTSGAIREFQVAVFPTRREPPAMIMLSTDGYANCFGNDFGFFQVGTDLLTYTRDRGPRFVANQLSGWLAESSRDGSGDDITVALAIRSSVLKSA